MRRMLIAGLWVATLAVAFFAGRETGAPDPGLSPSGGPGTLRAENELLRAENRRLCAAVPPAPVAPEDSTAGRGPDAGDRLAGPELPEPATATVGARPNLAGIGSAAEASVRLMAFADGQLDRGPAGYLAILETLEEISNSKALERLFPDEATALRQAYPWLRFAVERDGKIADMTEWLFRTMAEEPSVFAELDDDPIEIFAEGIAPILAGAVSAERLAKLNAWAARILAAPEASQPPAIRKNRSEIERLVARYWAEPIDLDVALEKIRSGELGPDDPRFAELLRSIPPEELAGLDLTSLLGPLVAGGRYEAFNALTRLPRDAVDPAGLDAHILRGLDEDQVDANYLRNYLRFTGRTTWEGVRGLVERALGGSEPSRLSALRTLLFLRGEDRPPKEWVADALLRYRAPENLAKQLRATYGIE